MGAFCVFGISRTVCRAVAAKKVPTIDTETKKSLAPAEWAVRRDLLAEQLFNNATRRVRISPELDAPQFCRDWIAADPAHVRDTVLMVRGPKIDKHGNRVIRDGAPVETWLDYRSECDRLGIPAAT
jgi:hypothetical protein